MARAATAKRIPTVQPVTTAESLGWHAENATRETSDPAPTCRHGTRGLSACTPYYAGRLSAADFVDRSCVRRPDGWVHWQHDGVMLRRLNGESAWSVLPSAHRPRPRFGLNVSYDGEPSKSRLTKFASAIPLRLGIAGARTIGEVREIRDWRAARASELHKTIRRVRSQLEKARVRERPRLRRDLQRAWSELMTLQPIPVGARLTEHRPRCADGEWFQAVASVVDRPVIAVVRAAYAHLEGAPPEWLEGRAPAAMTSKLRELERFAKLEANRAARQKFQHSLRDRYRR